MPSPAGLGVHSASQASFGWQSYAGFPNIFVSLVTLFIGFPPQALLSEEKLTYVNCPRRPWRRIRRTSESRLADKLFTEDGN